MWAVYYVYILALILVYVLTKQALRFGSKPQDSGKRPWQAIVRDYYTHHRQEELALSLTPWGRRQLKHHIWKPPRFCPMPLFPWLIVTWIHSL